MDIAPCPRLQLLLAAPEEDLAMGSAAPSFSSFLFSCRAVSSLVSAAAANKGGKLEASAHEPAAAKQILLNLKESGKGNGATRLKHPTGT